MYDHYLSNFCRPYVPNDICKDSATRHPQVLEKKIFKSVYHIWAWLPSWSMDGNYFSNLSFMCPGRLQMKFEKHWPRDCRGDIIWNSENFSHTNAKGSKLDLAKIMYDHYFSNFGRLPVPNDLCKDSAIRHPRFWRRRFLKVFTIYGHGGQFGQWTMTILAIFCSPNLRRLHMKSEQNWLWGFREEVIWKC